MHEGVNCTQCHTKLVFSNVGTQCADCHADIHKRQMGASCEQCHSVRGWSVAIQQINQHLNRFPLIGAHAALVCDSCHKSAAVGQFKGLSTACYSCHQRDFINTRTTGLDHVKLNLPTSCEQCHTMDNWMGAKFDHLQFTGFALTGAHSNLDCAACHVGGKFVGTPATCVGCHLADFNKTSNPPHAQAGFPTTCQTCHNSSSWNVATFNHNTFTKFPLTGSHVNVACTQCHINGQFVGTASDCASCHIKDFNGTTNPNHVQGGFPTTCQQCHTTTTWNNATFDHNTTGFPLTGAHTGVQCGQCHVNGNYNLTSANTACVGCHLKDFQGTTQPNHVQSGFPQTCQQCHTTTTWTGAAFDHSTTGFPLTGAHTTVQCVQCHVNNNYALTSANAACVSCHLKDFQGTTQPNHVQSNFPQTCTQCHNTTTWTGANFDHATTGFALTGAHTTVQCVQCHVNNNYALTSANAACVSCHLKDFQGTTQPNHVQANFSQTCTQCHNTTAWMGANFDHATTGFPLTGAHTALQCAQCHTNGNYKLTSANTACVGCHLKDFQGTTNPNHVSNGFPQTCEQCHNTTAWTAATFNHNNTGFPLTGAHTSVQCVQCHVNNNYNLTSAACVNCHLKDFQGTTQPNHVQANFAQTCQQCHSTASWNGASFDHSTTGFPLTGAHTTVQCVQCHVNNNYNLTSANTACVSCHLKDFQGTTNPNHVSGGFPQTCQQCHSTTAWTGATFDHSTTGFPLTGAHTTVQCVQCHVNNNYNLTSANTACVSCHLKDFQGTTNPNHVTSGFPQTCQQCHTTAAWTGATFDHSTTGFPLTGAHTSLQCVQCHVNNNYNLTSANTACVSCHLKDFQGTTNPNHVQASFPQTCQQCHTTATWGNATFDHATTGFTLTGAHTTLQCTQCHVNGNYSLTSANTTCINCHQNDFSATNNPPHVAAGFSQSCQQCHTTATWTNATFNHSTTGFTLTGAHTSLQCAQCHTNNNYKLTSGACAQCHLTDFQGTTNPNHAQAGFPQTCDQCHTTTNWGNGTFNHASTGFTLTGAHTTLQCTQCHVNGNYSLTSANTACVSCHQTDYNNTKNPSHTQVGFPTTCDACHSTTNWSGATFNHNTTTFPLTGAHTTVACTNCHVNNNYTTLPTACVGCHQADYNGTTNPNHASAGFPNTCATCHTTTAWTGATFNHAYFPTNHGNANGVCATCHTNPSDYAVFQCTNCHGGGNSGNFSHPRVSGYVYNSANCYQCHPQGRN
jgi:hypothetical protein